MIKSITQVTRRKDIFRNKRIRGMLDSSFLGCSVLMLTNLIDNFLHLSMLFKQDIQTGMMMLVLTVFI